MSRELDHDCFCLQKYFEVHSHHPLSEFCEDVQDINRTLQCFGLLSSSLHLLQLIDVMIRCFWFFSRLYANWFFTASGENVKSWRCLSVTFSCFMSQPSDLTSSSALCAPWVAASRLLTRFFVCMNFVQGKSFSTMVDCQQNQWQYHRILMHGSQMQVLSWRQESQNFPIMCNQDDLLVEYEPIQKRWHSWINCFRFYFLSIHHQYTW